MLHLLCMYSAKLSLHLCSTAIHNNNLLKLSKDKDYATYENCKYNNEILLVLIILLVVYSKCISIVVSVTYITNWHSFVASIFFVNSYIIYNNSNIITVISVTLTFLITIAVHSIQFNKRTLLIPALYTVSDFSYH